MSRLTDSLVIAWGLILIAQVSEASTGNPVPTLELCFAPGTSQEAVERAYADAGLYGEDHSLGHTDSFRFRIGNRWSTTATDGSGLGQGDPTTLTWGILPDGVMISSGVGEPAAPSNLWAFLNSIYGAGNWLPIFQQVFDRWAELTGITYVYEASDDGATFVNSPGVLGVRADVRIGGHYIDDDSGILAYNWYPNSGDMVIDTADSFFNNTSNGSIRLRNVLAHEHGHGMGLRHVCPINQTKLMEPYLTTSFDGPQHDDILGANRSYGDIAEDDDTQGTAFQLGSVGGGGLSQDLAIDDDSDIDFLAFTLDGGDAVDVTVTPIGFQYLEGPQNGDGSCTPGTMFDSLPIHDLALTVRDSNGTVLAAVDATAAGEPEQLMAVLIPGGNGYIEIEGDSADNAQLYSLEMNADSLTMLFADDFESGTFGAWDQTSQ